MFSGSFAIRFLWTCGRNAALNFRRPPAIEEVLHDEKYSARNILREGLPCRPEYSGTTADGFRCPAMVMIGHECSRNSAPVGGQKRGRGNFKDEKATDQ